MNSDNQEKDNGNQKESVINDFLRTQILNDPEFKRYCEYYDFKDMEEDKKIMSFVIWKRWNSI